MRASMNSLSGKRTSNPSRAVFTSGSTARGGFSAAAAGAFLLLFLLARPALATEKFALAVYHFNVQYVQGGLIGFPDEETMAAQTNLDDIALQDVIIKNSFEPLIDVYLRHPDWGCDIEMQGLMMDAIAARHPDVLNKMKTLANAGKVSFDSFHWSDQFWIAYPRVDMERSHDLVVKSFQNAGIPLGKSIFTQEGQFGPGMERFFRERGIRTAMVAGGVVGSTGNFPTEALNTLGSGSDVFAVVAPCGSHAPGNTVDSTACTGQHDDRVEVIWDWRDDGELAVTGGSDPYLGTAMTYQVELTQKFEQQLVDEETAGYRHVSVDTYVDEALRLGEQPKPLPQLVDGVWHHDPFMWMGGTSLWDGLAATIRTSADNEVLTGNMQARRKLLQVEAAAKELGLTSYFAEALEQAWRELLMAECSDGTGQNPWAGERKYSQAHARTALQMAEHMLADPKVSAHLVPKPISYALADDAGPFQVQFPSDAHRLPHVKWQKRKDANIWELSVSFDSLPDEISDGLRHRVRIDFPRTGENLIWSEALEDEKVLTKPLSEINGTDVDLPDGGKGATVIIPAANGLIGLGDGVYVIKRTETVHVAAHFSKDAPIVTFKDDTATTDAFTWKFIVVKGTEEDAIREVLAANVNPEPLGTPAKKGCGCDATTGAGALALLGLVARRRRRTLQ